MPKPNRLIRQAIVSLNALIARMTDFISKSIIGFIDGVVITHPWKTMICLLCVVAGLGFFVKDFKIDASSETLIQENDESLRYARTIYSRYGIQDFLFIAYTPRKDLLSDAVLGDIKRLKADIAALKRVDSVITILDVPLLESPRIPIKELAGKVPTLESPLVDRRLARTEMKNSPLYQNLLVSPDLKTTAIQVNFKTDEEFPRLIKARDELRDKAAVSELTEAEGAKLDQIIADLSRNNEISEKNRHEDIAAIRAIMDKYRGNADLFLGGVSMVADDLIRFVKNDLRVFSVGVFLFLILTMSVIFKKARWVMLPMLCCIFAAIVMVGILGLFGWKVTVISSNFVSIQLIITMTYAMHLVVRYREFLSETPEASQRELVSKTVHVMLVPFLYAALTTIVGFGSLASCDIKPVITFGWMMMAGITVSLVMTLIFFPAGLMILKKTPPPPPASARYSLSPFLARLTESRGKLILLLFAGLLILSAVGISRLVVENAFINYFKEKTEIHQGMKVIDQQLGGTTPLDVVVDLNDPSTPPDNPPETTANAQAIDGTVDTTDEFGDFEEFETKEKDNKYWFTPHKMKKIMAIHDYLDKLPETGKVLSLGTMMKIADTLNDGKPLDSFELSLVYNEIPEKFKDMLVKPFASIENNQVRFFVRVKDTEPTLRRDELIRKIEHDLVAKLGYRPENVHLTGMMVLYNNMLQSLFDSQIRTLGITVITMMFMYFILFRSFGLSFIAIFPSMISITVVLGFMGWMKMPLDMMTITIASICVGMADDYAIHYIHRFMEEIKIDRNYIRAMHRCHGSIGFDMYYTSITIIIGFSILALSNFIPSIVFGLLTGLAMLIALITSLTVLPALIVLIRPFGPGSQKA
ncbi:MAG: MMPL family transporter [Desulfosalsimonadaceae bacterium]